MKKINVFSKPNCVACRQTAKKLNSLGLEYNYTDITENPEAHNKVVELGFMQAPVVLVTDENDNIIESFSGYQPEKLSQLA